MTLALKLLQYRATWGVGIAVGVLLAVWANGAVKYRAGVSDGKAQEKAAWSSEVALARASATASQVAADAITSALTDSLRIARAESAELREKLALARGNYHEALGWYRAAVAARDTTVPITPEQRACDVVVSSCANALAAEAAVTAALTAQLHTAERLVAVQDSVIRTEPTRTTLSNREAMANQRAAFKAPSRVTWGAVGAVVGVASAWWVVR